MKQIILLCFIVGLVTGLTQLSAAPNNNDDREIVPLVTKMTLTAVELGDISCYVSGVDDKGAEHILSADVDLCPGEPLDVSHLIGVPVLLTWGKANVLSASCDGDIDCGRSDYIDIVTSLAAVRR